MKTSQVMMSDSESSEDEVEVEEHHADARLWDNPEFFVGEFEDEDDREVLLNYLGWGGAPEPQLLLHGAGPPHPVWRKTLDASAVAVGTDTGGGPLYVGRSIHSGHLLPAKVAPAHQGAFVAWGGMELSRFHGSYEILHLPRGNAAWEPASDGDIPSHAFPVGCTAQGLPVFVARVKYLDTDSPGRLIPNEGACYISYAGKEIGCSEYEVLTIY